MRLMTEQRVRHLVVLRDGAMVGVVSIGDLVKCRLQDAELESRVLRDIALGHLAAE
jgi:signal-transduction protein with cAMP-binding, CBS, and nucleotidyltransferase domain